MENRFNYCNITPYNATELTGQPKGYLSNFFHPVIEGFMSWDEFRHYFTNLYDKTYYESKFLLFPLSEPYAYPAFCKCFGILGDFVRKNYKYFLDEDAIKMSFITNPDIIINFIENITQSHINIYIDGNNYED